MNPAVRLFVAPALLAGGAALAQQLDARFSCSTVRNEDGEQVTYADHGEMHIVGDRIAGFAWESAQYRSTHGFDCSIDEDDGLVAQVRDEAPKTVWRVALQDAQAARERRGYQFDRLMRCTIRLEREGDTLRIAPSCPALCGSRGNFSELSVNLKTGECRYEEE